MVDQGYQTFSVVLTSILIALIILLLIIMFLDIIINRGGLYKDAGIFNRLIYYLDIFGKIFKTRPHYNKDIGAPPSSVGGQLSQSTDSEIFNKPQGLSGGCGSCNNFNLSSSLTYDPQIFLKKRNH